MIVPSNYLEDTLDNPVLSCLVHSRVEHKFPDCTKSIGHRHAQRCPNRTHLKKKTFVTYLLQWHNKGQSLVLASPEPSFLSVMWSAKTAFLKRATVGTRMASCSDLTSGEKRGRGWRVSVRPFSTLSVCNF